MRTYSRSHLSNSTLVCSAKANLSRERTATADLLADLAEIDARKLYVPAAYPSMYAWCVGELGLAEDAAYKRIQAARVAREFPAIFSMVAEGELNLSGVGELATYLTAETADDLLRSAAGRSNAEIRTMLADRFPRSELLPMVVGLTEAGPEFRQLAVPQVDEIASAPASVISQMEEAQSVRVEQARSRVAPLAPGRFSVTFTIGQSTQDKLRYVQELLGHQIPSGDLAALFDRALDALSTRLEKQKFGATDKPRGVMVRSSEPSRHIPAGVRRAVWKRDRGRCTFVGDSGRRCSARSGIEFDHIDPVARGGESTAANLRLRCRAHNQFEAERAFGTAFIEAKREAARRDAEEREGKEQERDLIAGLRGLGFRAGEARRGLESIAGVPSLSLEERIRLALSSLGRSPRLGKTIRSSAA